MSFVIFALLVLVPLSRNSDPRSLRARLFSTTARALQFYREKDSAFSSLVDSRRIAVIGALNSWCLLRIKKLHTLDTTLLIVVLEVNH